MRAPSEKEKKETSKKLEKDKTFEQLRASIFNGSLANMPAASGTPATPGKKK